MKISLLIGAIVYCGLSVCPSLAINHIPKSDQALVNSLANAQKEDKVQVPSFDVNVTLSEKAQRKLESAKETIIISAYIYGLPKPNSSVKVNEVGFVDLATHQIELPKAGKAEFKDMSVPGSKLDQLASKDYKVNVNVFSGRKSSQDNLLSCDIFDDAISKLQAGITLKCKLIAE